MPAVTLTANDAGGNAALTAEVLVHITQGVVDISLDNSTWFSCAAGGPLAQSVRGADGQTLYWRNTRDYPAAFTYAAA